MFWDLELHELLQHLHLWTAQTFLQSQAWPAKCKTLPVSNQGSKSESTAKVGPIIPNPH